MRKKKYKILLSLIVFFVSVIAIVFSDSSPKTLSSRQSEFPTKSIVQENNTKNESSIENLNTSSSSESSILSESRFRVIKVVDGDTFDVEINGKIERLRMIGIDTPETVDPRKSVQCFGKEASNKAKEILTNQLVVLEGDSTQGNRDKYGRLLRYAFLPDGTNYGLFMVSEGYAHEYTYRYPYKYQSDFKQAEVSARENNKGLWAPNTCLGSI